MSLATRVFGLPRWIRARIRRSLLPGWTHTSRSLAYGPADRQVLDVVRPRWPSDRPRPVVVTFHGGGWTEGSRASLVDRMCRRYLEHGFVVVNVEYRAGLAPASEDAIRALEWTFDHVASHGGDPDRVFVTGESAGGHLALLAAFTCGPRVRAVINFYAATDLVGYLHACTAPAVPTVDALRTLSPLYLVRPDVCSVLSIHGTADAVVPLDHTSRLTRRLRQAGVAAEELIVDGGRHGFTEAELDAIYERIFRFVRAQDSISTEGRALGRWTSVPGKAVWNVWNRRRASRVVTPFARDARRDGVDVAPSGP